MAQDWLALTHNMVPLNHLQEEEEEEEEQEEGEGEEEEEEEEQEQGVLLYYKFVEVGEPEKVGEWFRALCSSLSLLGRVRVAPDGVNVTVGGTIACLRKHISVVERHPLFTGCDFKLAKATNFISANSKIADDCGFSSLSVRLVKELVTLGVHPSLMPPSIKNAGKHLSPQEFHRILQDVGAADGLCGCEVDLVHTQSRTETVCPETITAGKCPKCDLGSTSEVVILDARNIYETRIGKFRPPPGVEFLESFSRQYSDFPVWIDQNIDRLRHKQILMYCTGGVRCEMASAYIRSKGAGFKDVFQLSGGIQRYMEAFPDGGFFKGKNFVFDYRIAVPSSVEEVISSCLSCGIPYDDYSSRTRCRQCRMLILICPNCQVIDKRTLDTEGYSFTCELCQKHDKDVALCKPSAEDVQQEYKGIAKSDEEISACKVPTFNAGHSWHPKSKLRILCLHGFRQNALNFKGRLASFCKKLKHVAEFVFVDAPHELPFICQLQHNMSAVIADGDRVKALHAESLPKIWKKKYAWLIDPSTQTIMDVNALASLENQYWISKQAFDPLQYQTQKAGWSETWKSLKRTFGELGPFDGVLGFSQGASVAAALCPLRNRTNIYDHTVNFNFVILCSGFPSPVDEHKSLMPQPDGGQLFDCPSLHIFCGSAGYDRQIICEESKSLASMFETNSRVIVEHSSGHMIPTQPEYIQQYLNFLNQFRFH